MPPMSLAHHASETGQVSPPIFKSHREDTVPVKPHHKVAAHLWGSESQGHIKKECPGQIPIHSQKMVSFRKFCFWDADKIKEKDKMKILSRYSHKVCLLPKPVFQVIFFWRLYSLLFAFVCLSAFYKCTHDIISLSFLITRRRKGRRSPRRSRRTTLIFEQFK